MRAEEFHRSPPLPSSGPNDTSGFDTASVAICDPHQGLSGLAASNQQQSVPSRVSNPFACTAAGGDNPALGPLDHDCYDVTIVGVYRKRTDPYHPKDELWGTPVRVIVANPTRGSATSSVTSRPISSRSNWSIRSVRAVIGDQTCLGAQMGAMAKARASTRASARTLGLMARRSVASALRAVA